MKCIFAIALSLAMLAPFAPAAETIEVVLGYRPTVTEVPQLDRKGNPKLDGKGRPKMKRYNSSEPITQSLTRLTGTLVNAQTVTGYLGEQTQYRYVSPACLNNVWCHIIVGDPSSTSTPVYLTSAVFTIKGAEATYVAYERGSSYINGQPINSTVSFAILGSTLYLADEHDHTRELTIYQTILNHIAR